MNILIAADYATPAGGNFIASCIELGRMLHKHGDQLCFVVPENHNTLSAGSWIHWLRQEGFSVDLVRKNELSEIDQLHFLQEIIRKYDIDILHIHFGMFHHLVLSHRGELPVKILVHDHMDFSVGSRMQKEQQKLRLLLNSVRYRSKKISVVSVNPTKNHYYAFTRHWYVPNRLSLLRNIPASLSREDCRKNLGFRETDKVCMLLGWDMYRKGLDVAVKAVAEARKTDPDICLAVVGMGYPAAQQAYDFIRERTDIAPDSPWIHFLPSTEDMFAYHRSIDVYLSASRSEAFAYGILETISQNTPVVVSEIKGTSWCWKYSKTLKYPTEDPAACADALKQALALGRSASNYQEIVDEYSIDKWCQQMAEIYRTL